MTIRVFPVEDDTKLRKQLREAGVDYFVAKNTMLRLAAKEAGYEGLNEYFEGTTAVAISDTDPVSAAKILNDYAEEAKANFNLKAGMVEGRIFDKAGIEAIAKLPSKDQLLAQLCSVLKRKYPWSGCCTERHRRKGRAGNRITIIFLMNQFTYFRR